ncbi:mucin-2-like [Mytilus californianus]|uniref:mucin-2-like n=1 Tax=Mytilus californianus TaxID=6549 RepID=UPI00224605A6|nr:mucin-2-like [Mytilus californianus]
MLYQESEDLSTCPTRIQTLKHVRVYTDVCLLFVENELSWDDAHKSCKNLGGDLVTIKDSAKEKFILDSLKLEHWNAANVWIGATDKGTSVTYGHFAKGQGNNHNTGFLFAGGSNEDCALIRRSDGGLWHDYPCHPIVGNIGYHYTYACEFPKIKMATTLAPMTNISSSATTTVMSSKITMPQTTAMSNVETPAPTTMPKAETPAPTTTMTNVETPAPTTMPKAETPAPTTTMANVETPAPTTMPKAETPAPTTTMANVETPAPTTIPKAETPAPTTNLPNIETPARTTPQPNKETPTSTLPPPTAIIGRRRRR